MELEYLEIAVTIVAAYVTAHVLIWVWAGFPVLGL